jgi:hypothetical protein
MKEYREVLHRLKDHVILKIEEQVGYGHWVITTNHAVFDLWFDGIQKTCVCTMNIQGTHDVVDRLLLIKFIFRIKMYNGTSKSWPV